MNQKRWLGLVFVIIGGFILLGNLGVLENFWGVIGTYWPILLILAGTYNILTNPAGKAGGVVVFTAGSLLLVNNMDQVQVFNRVSFWPIILILVGLWFIFRGGKEPNVVEKDSINLVALFSGNSSRVVSDNFKGGSSVSLFGGTEVDLRDSRISDSEVKFDVFAMFGGADIYVPESWRVVAKGLPLFGGMDDKTTAETEDSGEKEGTLVINYLALFGGVEVKN
jgi:predicted membrane protein